MARPRKYETPEEFDLMVDLYVADCTVEKRPMTVTGLALALGFCDKTSIYEYREREAFTHSVKRALAIVENGYAESVARGGQVAGPIFLLKASYNYKDTQTVEVLPLHVTIEGKDSKL